MKAILVNTDVSGMHGDYLQALLDWARGLGLDTKVATPRFALIEHDDGWHGHFAIKLQRDGHDYIAPGTNNVATDYDHDLRIGEPNWPNWFPDAVAVPDMPPAHLVEVLHLASQARHDLEWRVRGFGTAQG